MDEEITVVKTEGNVKESLTILKGDGEDEDVGVGREAYFTKTIPSREMEFTNENEQRLIN